MKGTDIFRFSCITILWLVLCWAVIASSPQITFMTVFAIIASGIVVFVPIYKKYRKNERNKQ